MQQNPNNDAVRFAKLPSVRWQERLGQRDAKEGIPPVLNTQPYLTGYGREYFAGEHYTNEDEYEL